MSNLIETAKNNGEKRYHIFSNHSVYSLLKNCELRWRNKKQTSLELFSKNVKDPSDLIELFGLDVEMFKGKFVQAILGAGHEYNEIRTLHSSSLLALLCFYNVSALHPLHCSIDSKNVLFTESLFEIQNPIPGSDRPSNIDVVLIGKDELSGRKVTLFLESKFSEYLTHSEKDNISTPVYRDIYHIINKTLDTIGVSYDEYSDKYSRLIYKDKKCTHYLEGVKQVVSHFLGVRSIATDERAINEDIYLGEILFKFPEEVDTKHKKYNDYTQIYETLAKGLNSITDSKFKVVGHCFTYQDVFKSFDLDDAVRAFYSLPID